MRDALGLIDDTYFEILDFHHQRLADVATYLTSTRDWDLLMVETHASDYTGHFFLSWADAHSGGCPVRVEAVPGGRPANLFVDRPDDWPDPEAGGQGYGHLRCIRLRRNLPAVQGGGRREGAGGDRLPEVQGAREEPGSRFLPHEGDGRGADSHLREPEAVRRDLIAALYDYKDPETGRRPFALAVTREDAEMVNLWSELVGDVAYALRPEFDGAHGKQLPSASFGMAGQHSTFIASGAGIRHAGKLEREVRVIDVAPTVCYLTGTPLPQNVEGGVVYEALREPDWAINALR